MAIFGLSIFILQSTMLATSGTRKRSASGSRTVKRVRLAPKYAAPRQELDFLDTAVVTDATTTAVVLLLNGMAQGTTASTRVGRKIMIKSIQWKISAAAESLLNQVGSRIHWALVWDKQSNGAAPAYTDIYDTATPTSMFNISNSSRFVILKSDDVVVTGVNNNGTNMATVGAHQIINGYRRCELPVQYNAGNAGTVADIQTGGLFLVYVGDIAAGTSDVDMTGVVRIRYTD